MKSWLTVVALIAAFALLIPTCASAQGKGKGKPSGQAAAKEKDKSKQKDAKQQEKAEKEKDKADKDKDRGWEAREGYEYRTFEGRDRDSRPPGWSRGKKTGWDNCGVPPGQAKKGACRTYRHEGRRYFYYYDSQGRMVVRRSGPEDGR